MWPVVWGRLWPLGATGGAAGASTRSSPEAHEVVASVTWKVDEVGWGVCGWWEGGHAAVSEEAQTCAAFTVQLSHSVVFDDIRRS